MPGQRPALRYGGGTAVRQHLPQSVSILGSSSGISREDCPSSWEERRLGPQSRPRGGRVTCVCRRCGFGDKEPRIRPSPAASSKAGVGSSKSRGGGLPAAPRPLPGRGAVVPGSHAAQERTPRLCLVRWGPRCWGGVAFKPPPLGKILLFPCVRLLFSSSKCFPFKSRGKVS